MSVVFMPSFVYVNNVAIFTNSGVSDNSACDQIMMYLTFHPHCSHSCES